MRNWFTAWISEVFGNPDPAQEIGEPDAGSRCRILIATQHAILGRGLKQIIHEQDDMVVIGILQEGSEIVRQTETLRPDVVIVDMQLRSPDGLKILKRITRKYAGIRVIVLSLDSTQARAQEARRHGALGFVGKQRCPTALADAVRAVRAGRYFEKC